MEWQTFLFLSLGVLKGTTEPVGGLSLLIISADLAIASWVHCSNIDLISDKWVPLLQSSRAQASSLNGCIKYAYAFEDTVSVLWRISQDLVNSLKSPSKLYFFLEK